MYHFSLLQYGFTKVRRGPETDMYAHPRFLRDRPMSLLDLRKTSSTSNARSISDASSTVGATIWMTRAVSPSFSGSTPPSPTCKSPTRNSPDDATRRFSDCPKFSLAPRQLALTHSLSPSSASCSDRGKLDLLTFAMESEFCQL
jgi:hypothetical protein